jgi:hypothetical protein
MHRLNILHLPLGGGSKASNLLLLLLHKLVIKQLRVLCVSRVVY